jgi:putative nucleotidyltransferase with HDIG domain
MMNNQELPQQIVQGLAAACKGLRLYPLEHPAISRQMELLVDRIFSMLRTQDTIRMGQLEGTLFLEDHLFVDGSPAAAEMIALLKHIEIDGLEFIHGVTALELKHLVRVLHDGRARGEDFNKILHAHGVRHIRPLRIKDEDQDQEHSPRAIYNRALEVVDRIFHDVRMGTVPTSEGAIKTVKSMVHMTLTEPHALFAMSMLKDYDNYTFTHSVNVAVLALTVGRACGLEEEQLRVLGLGALLHDIGKLKIDWEIINKPGQLTDEEFEQIKQHPTNGADIVRQMEGITPEIIDIVLGHHLRYNREGYPADARGQSASPMVDMAAIADTYDAMTTLRSYQRPMTPKSAIARLKGLSGSILHPVFLDSFINFLGPYPVGTLVRLNTNEIALVTWVSTERRNELRIKVLFDSDGTPLTDPEIKELNAESTASIIAEVDPFSKGIDVTDYLD